MRLGDGRPTRRAPSNSYDRFMVIVTSDFPPPAHGGIERYMISLSRALSNQGELVVVAPYVSECETHDTTLPYRILRYRRNRKAGWLLEVLQIIQAAVRAHHLSNDRRTIASSWIRSGFACALLPKQIRGELAIIAHGTEVLSVRNPLKIAAMRWAFRRADAVVANSTSTAQILAQRGVRSSTVSYCGVSFAPMNRAPAKHPRLLSVGRLVRRKGFDRTIEALPIVLERFPQLQYEIVGAGPDDEYLRGRVRDLGLENHVRFLGEISDDALAKAYARAWCFVLPTRKVQGDIEGFGIVYLEAAMAGLPAIGGHGCGAEDAIDNGRSGILVDGDDVSQIAAAIIAVLEDPERSRSMGEYGRARAQTEFGWERVASRITESLPARPVAAYSPASRSEQPTAYVRGHRRQ
jgi:phosphatidyl-myo-inositol dimannoside synthase